MNSKTSSQSSSDWYTSRCIWYRAMRNILEEYKYMADQHWENGYHDVIRKLEARIQSRDLQLHKADDEKAKRRMQEFACVCQTVPHHQSEIDIDAIQSSICLIREKTRMLKREMYHKLGLWLCSYFMGVPRIDIWEEVATCANKLGAYPGGAFYSKLAGDIYRYELNQYKKQAKDNRTPSVYRFDGILVMGYTPILLLPDKEDVLYVSNEEDEELVEEYDKEVCTVGERRTEYLQNYIAFCKDVETLACRYYRLQMWRYLREGYPIRVAVAQGSASETLKRLAEKRTLGIDVLHVECSERLQQYFTCKKNAGTLVEKPGASPEQWVRVFVKNATQTRGLTSCTLGREYGIVANRPNHANESTAFCTWAENVVLNVEREKLLDIWDDVQNPQLFYTLWSPNYKIYSSAWCLP